MAVFLTVLLLNPLNVGLASEWKAADGQLMTRWAKNVSPDRVWPEHPRPQMVRERPQWLNLNGLWNYAIPHRRMMVLASLYSILNKIFDLAPPLLIGAAVDTVVQQQDSLIAKFGVQEVGDQLLVLAGVTAIIWFFESFFQYLYQVAWRNLAQTIQHDLRLDTYDHVQHLKHLFLRLAH